MEKKKVVIIASIAVAAILVIGCSLLFLGQGGSSDPQDDELSANDQMLPSELTPKNDESVTEAGSITGVDTDGDGVADEVAGEGSNAGANSGSNGSGNSGNSSGTNQNTPTWPEGEAPADDGSTTQGVTYSQYHAMSAAEQQAWFESFESVEAFFVWYNEAKAVHDANDDSIIIDGNTNIDMGEIAKKQS